MFEDLATNITALIVQVTSIFVISALGVLVGFPLVQLGSHWGKIKGSKKFQSKELLFVGFLASIMLVGVFFELAKPYIDGLLKTYLVWIPTVVASLVLLLYAWFSKSFDFKPNWKVIAVLILLVVIDVGIIYLVQYYH